MKIFFLLCSAFYYNCLFAQVVPKEPVTIIPPSPTAASLGKYGDVPVSLYNGTVGANIPIYTINTGTFSLPISLQYHGSGIKVEQESSWVGLGWNLSAGGVITRSVRGLDDFDFQMKGTGYPDTKFDIAGAFIYGEDVFKACRGNLDTEPDIFYFNIPGASGKFYLEQRSNLNDPYTFRVESKQKIKIEYDKYTETWSLFTADGTFYQFSIPELTTSELRTMALRPSNEFYKFLLDQDIEQDYLNPPEINYHVSSWYLKKIVSQFGDEVNFEYTINPVSVATTKSLSEKRVDGYVTGVECVPDLTSHVVYVRKNSNNEIYLKRIISRDICIEFELSDRYDLQPNSEVHAKKLDKIKLYRIGNTVPIKQFRLNYDYFIAGGATYDNTYSSKRLKLTSFCQLSINGMDSINTYSFDYVKKGNISIPDKYSSGKDYWGYFNGKNNDNILTNWKYLSNTIIRTQIPFVDGISAGPYSKGANRRPDNNFVTVGMLNKINYPTGGSTYFEYENNEFNGYGSILIGPGVRIRKTIDYDGINHVNDIIKKYVYRSDINSPYSSGSLMNTRLNEYSGNYFYRYNLNCNNNGDAPAILPIHLDFRVSESEVPLGSSNSGSILGYSSVFVFKGENHENGIEEFQYFNTPSGHDPLYPSLPVEISIENGLLKESTLYNRDLKKIRKSIFTYENVSLNESLLPGVKCYGCEYVFNGNTNVNQENYLHPLVERVVYKNKSEWWQLTSEDVILYDTIFNVPSFTNGSRMFYDNLSHMQVTRKTTVNSNGDSITVKYNYPGDFQAKQGIISFMKDAHIHNMPIEKIVTKDKGTLTKYIAATFTEFMQNAGGIVPKKTYIIENNHPVTEFESSVNNIGTGMPVDPKYKFFREFKYNPYFNSVEEIDENGDKTVYLWAYSSQYPVAKIVGSNLESVKSVITNHQLASISEEIALRELLNTLRTDSRTKMSLITTYTYKPLIGMTSETNPAGKTTFYEYDSFGRLILIKDDQGNIIKKICYNYSGQKIDCAGNYITTAHWTTTTNTRCTKDLNGSNNGFIEVEEIDENIHSSSYNSSRWITLYYSEVSCPLPTTPNWVQIYDSIKCERDSLNQNTGRVVGMFKDINPLSLTYNQTIWKHLPEMETGSCPIGSCFQEDCSIQGEAFRCINGVCEQGIKVYFYTEYYPSSGQYLCFYQYEYSDGSTYFDPAMFQEIYYSSCTPEYSDTGL